MSRVAAVRVVVAMALAAVAVAACSSDSSVGSEDLLTFEQRQQAELGETTTTAAPATGDTTATSAPAQVSTTAPPATAPPAREPTLQIMIAGDDQRSQFQPPAARVFAGSLIRWVNTDSVARSVVADDGSFDSGPIAPGAHWDYVAGTPGRFNYSDGTRPYAVGILEVVPA